MRGYKPDPNYWTVKTQGGQTLYICKPCNDRKERVGANRAREHEQSRFHQEKLKAWRDRQRESEAAVSATPTTTDDIVLDDAVRALLGSFSTNEAAPLYPSSHPSLPPHANSKQRSPSPATGIDWNLMQARGDTHLDPSPLEKALADAAQASLDILNFGLSEDELDERSSVSEESDGGWGGRGSDDEQLGQPAEKRARNYQPDAKTQREWYPWVDRISCILDVFMHLPRSVFSQRQLDLLFFVLRSLGVHDVPSVRSMKSHNELLQKLYGIQTILYTGAMEDRFYVNSLAQILAQEMANPRVRPHLSFYPEDAGNHLSEARQASKWLHDMPSELTTPMIRLGDNDFYIFEPVMLNDGKVCIPHRWFTRQGVFFAKAWPMQQVAHNGHRGWEVHQDRSFEISQHQLVKNFISLKQDFTDYNIPNPCHIFAIRTAGGLMNWTYTSSETAYENPWRRRAQGHRVVAVPLWLYCDDTSGNVSKKWNEHNSYLFTLAGLSRDQVAKEYNVHYLCTSNIAPPIEMLEGVEDQISKAQETGIWAWDCELSEPVLMLPSVLAFLGDNPMQSEFACHIGMNGKYFCRACWVKGTDADSSPVSTASAPMPGPETSGGENASGSDSGLSEASSNGGNLLSQKSTVRIPKKRQKKVETVRQMIDRVSNFIKPGVPRHRSETIRTLDSFSSEAKKLYTKTKIKNAHTNTGIKDTFQEYFLSKLSKASEGCSGRNRQSLDDEIAKLPASIISPVWRLKGLDPHTDTPVEILHVALLGFVKYFWRDVVQNQLKGDDARKELLMRRLSDLDVAGLGIPRLNGKTLVKYCGSLTGRDFRAIAQCAPFCIYDLVTPPCLEAWQAMSQLVPLIWQPSIDDLDHYLESLEQSINFFLLKTAQWTCRWFNKPKFHVLVHLPNHIRRFGPAILFATEAFESFNTVIRAKSVHSNRQAPSRDIGLAFAQGNRIRHLISGGFFAAPPIASAAPRSATNNVWAISPTTTSCQMKTAGIGPLGMIGEGDILPSYLGISDSATEHRLSCHSLVEKDPKPFCECQAAHYSLWSAPPFSPSLQFFRYQRLTLADGENCNIGHYVVFQPTNVPTQQHLGIIREVLECADGDQGTFNSMIYVLLQVVEICGHDPRLYLPRLKATAQWDLVPVQNIICPVNTQHYCSRHHCGATGTRFVLQERHSSTKTVTAIEHVGPLDDRLLNLFQMRSTRHLNVFRPAIPRLNELDIIERSCAAEWDRNTAAAPDAESNDKSSQNTVPTRSRKGKGKSLTAPSRLAT